MKNKVLISAVLILAVLSLGTLTGIMLSEQGEPVVAATGSEDKGDDNILVVSGNGRVSLTPDIAHINAGVETVMKDAREAQAENAEIMNRIIDALKTLGIQDKDIQTANYSVHVEYDFSGNQRRLIGYRVSNNVRIAFRQIDRVGEVLTKLAESGANQFYGVSFGVENSTDAYSEALKKAIAEAKAEAQLMAQQAGVKLGKPVEIHEGSAPQGIQFGKAMDMARLESAAAQVPIMEGELEVQANVTIIYSIE